MMLTKQQIAKTILALINSGRRMPQVVVPEDPNKVPTVEDTLRTTVDLWFDLYGDKVSPERWAAAERIALTMASPAGVPQNIISTALMGEALRKAQNEYIEEQRASAPSGAIRPSEEASWQTKVLWRWTVNKLREGRNIGEYMPSHSECVKYGRDLGLAEHDIEAQLNIIKIYLNDCKYAAKNGKRMMLRLAAKNNQLYFEKLA